MLPRQFGELHIPPPVGRARKPRWGNRFTFLAKAGGLRLVRLLADEVPPPGAPPGAPPPCVATGHDEDKFDCNVSVSWDDLRPHLLAGLEPSRRARRRRPR